VTFAGLKIGLVPCRQDRMVFPGMPLGGGDVAQAAVAVLDVVPVHEVLSPLAGFVQAGEAARREFGAVLRRLKSDSTKALSSDTLGREYEGLIPSQCSIANTVVALSVLPLSPCSTGFPAGRGGLRPTRCA